MNTIDETVETQPAATSMPSGVFHLATGSPLRAATQDLPDRVNDLPAFYYWKDAIVVGSYVHPARGFSLDITRDRLDGFVNNFNRMRDNGVGVPILMDHAPTASATLGWIVEVNRDGDRLLELHQFLGEEARDIGLRNKVSLGIDPSFVDGKGIQYGEAIVHSAVTPTPVVPGQGEFEPMELSLQSEPAEPLPPVIAPMVDLRGALHLVLEMKRDQALARGGVTPAVAAELFELLVGSGNLLTLSRTDKGLPIAMAVFDALAKNRPAVLGECTGSQVLSRRIPGDDGSVDDLRHRMIELASGGKREAI